MAAAAGDEDPLRGVDPRLLHLGVVEEGLQRAEPGDPRHQLPHYGLVVGDRRDRTGEAELVVVAHERPRRCGVRAVPRAGGSVTEPRLLSRHCRRPPSRRRCCWPRPSERSASPGSTAAGRGAPRAVRSPTGRTGRRGRRHRCPDSFARHRLAGGSHEPLPAPPPPAATGGPRRDPPRRRRPTRGRRRTGRRRRRGCRAPGAGGRPPRRR